MSRYFLFGTLLWDALRADVAGGPVDCVPARLDGWQVERAAAGDWPVLVPGTGAGGQLTDTLGSEAKARLDWYETAFGYVPEAVTVTGPDGPVAALVYREAEGGGGAGLPWDLATWQATHGARTRLAAAEVMRARGKVTPAQIAARRGVIQARAHAIASNRTYRRPITQGTDTGADAVRVSRVDYPYEGFHRVEEWHLDHPRFDGGRSGTIQRAISHVVDAATVLPYDPVRDRVLVVDQIRVGALAKGDPLPWMIEPVAGLIDAGETPEQSALRELEEEAGLKIDAQALVFVARYYPSPGGLAQVLHSFVALCDLPDDAVGLHGVADEDEDIRVRLMPLDDLVAMVATGEAANAPLIVSAQWLALHRATLRG
ncbi:NUDIX domain-containing protein [Jannaschia pohangensis]|uniref:ADP-ribose pyrophosphatase n=1 Tax=Jannaschia pohangensis TaxID=390807 RepID=A0A1I3HHE0_9RHOB|nr:NUDIX domain-containing protein [Jannaschia pohangensis]SFI35102.1 nudix-type nucleoside diphosphatase, YffH/AdpP family [Jannaschia pohangensis]